MTMRARELERDVVLAHGDETISYVHSQVSQDVDDMAIGESRLSFLLQPQGKVDALLRITRVGEDRLVLDTDAGHGEAMVKSLAFFKLRTKVDFEPLDWKVVTVAADAAEDVDATGEEVRVEGLVAGTIDLIGPEPVVSGADVLTSEDYERLRVEAAFPRMGVDIDDGSIPNESGLVDRAVSFTKGCYRGQELVERIHARGGNRQMLQTLVVESAAAPGHAVLDGEREVGMITSIAVGDPLLALAYVRGDVEPDAQLTVATEAGPVAAQRR